MTKTIAVLGCGWLGLPLAVSLVDEGYEVHGSTTSKEKLAYLQERKIKPFLISLTEKGIEGDIESFLLKVDVLVINIPPKLRSGQKESYIDKITLLGKSIRTSRVKKVIFVSSTSVYGEIEGEVTENTVPKPSTESGRQLYTSEQLLANDNAFMTTIIRYGGLIGPERHPVTFLSGKQQLTNGAEPVNLIHLNDCIAILKEIISKDWWGESFNAVFPYHPNKNEYYTKEAQKRGLVTPDYLPKKENKGKKVVPEVLLNVKKYRFTTSIVS
ncbi:MAG: SDR family oxidoreductase [Flavobacteriaceae bacterium]